MQEIAAAMPKCTVPGLHWKLGGTQMSIAQAALLRVWSGGKGTSRSAPKRGGTRMQYLPLEAVAENKGRENSYCFC